MAKLSDFQRFFNGMYKKMFFNAANIGYNEYYKIVIKKENNVYRVAIETPCGTIKRYVPTLFSKSLKELYSVINSTIEFAESQIGIPVLEDGFERISADDGLSRYWRYNKEQGALYGEILGIKFNLKTETPLEQIDDDIIEQLEEYLVKRIVLCKTKYRSYQGELGVEITTTKNNIVTTKSKKKGDDYVYFDGWFYS